MVCGLHGAQAYVLPATGGVRDPGVQCVLDGCECDMRRKPYTEAALGNSQGIRWLPSEGSEHRPAAI